MEKLLKLFEDCRSNASIEHQYEDGYQYKIPIDKDCYVTLKVNRESYYIVHIQLRYIDEEGRKYEFYDRYHNTSFDPYSEVLRTFETDLFKVCVMDMWEKFSTFVK